MISANAFSQSMRNGKRWEILRVRNKLLNGHNRLVSFVNSDHLFIMGFAFMFLNLVIIKPESQFRLRKINFYTALVSLLLEGSYSVSYT